MPVPSMAVLQACKSAAAGFDPTSISGCKLWLDADDASTFTFASGVIVSAWADKSDQGNDVSQATGSKQPSRTLYGGGYGVAFAAEDVLKATPASEFGAVASVGLTVFCLFRKTGANNTYEALPAQLSTGNTGRPIEGYNNNRICEQSQMSAASGSFPNLNTFTSWTVLTSHISVSGASRPTWREYTDGVLTCTSHEFAGSVSSTSQKIVIGARDDETPLFTGDVAQVLMFDTPLGSTDREAVEAFLLDKASVLT